MKSDDIKIAHANYDIVFKSLTGLFKDQTLEFYGLKTAPIVCAEPAELPQIQIDERRMDFVFYLSDDSYMHLEFQTTVKEDDLLRFKLYDTLLYEQKRKPVRTAVIYGAGINSAPVFLDHGSIKYIVEPVFMGNYDGDEIYNDLLEKINAGLSLTVQDKLNLIFLPLMRNSVDKSRRAIDAIELAQKVEDKNEQIFLIGCLVGISDKFIDEEYVRNMMEVLRMTRVMQALYKEFKQEGIEEEKMETAKKMMEDKVDINLIVKYTGLMIEEIKELMKEDRD